MKTISTSASLATTLQCPSCGKMYSMALLQTFATCCQQPLITTYEHNIKDPHYLSGREHSIWRYRELLPVFNPGNIVSLGEGWTPLHSLSASSRKMGLAITLKDESINPTGSFKARGISVAVSKAKELDVRHCIIPTAGNAGGALSAYCAKARIKATVVMPRYTPAALQKECTLFGAELLLVDGMIDACGNLVRQMVQKNNAFDMSTLKEPYRLEGKKTMGYELAEQCNWRLPDVIIYPTGGGTGLIGIWKAFQEMKQMGWLTCKLPKMVAVQAANCAPVVQLFEQGRVTTNSNAVPSAALGLAVPNPFAKRLMLDVLHESEGIAVAVPEDAIEAGIKEVAKAEGILLSPEGSVAYSGLKMLAGKKWINEGSSVVLFNTGSWYKYS